jgi:phage-related protein
MQWAIEFYSEKVEADTIGFPAGILAHLVHILEMIEEMGPNLGMPYTRPMGDGLFEIRAKGREGIGRSLFCTVKGRKIIILHSFIKKSQKTPRRELKTAITRMKEVKS